MVCSRFTFCFKFMSEGPRLFPPVRDVILPGTGSPLGWFSVQAIGLLRSQFSGSTTIVLSRSLPPVKLWQGHRNACHSVRNFTEAWNWFWRFDLAWGCPSECSHTGIDRKLTLYSREFSIPNPETCGVSESDRYPSVRTRYEG